MLRRLLIDNLVLIRTADIEFGPGLNVVTGETGAGKTILTQAIGPLLGAKGDAALVGPAGSEAYVEAELDLPAALLEDGLEALADLRPGDDPGLVVARRVFADGRSRAYAWGRAAPREDVAAAVERLVAMSGQFEQRRLGRPAHQLELLDAYAGDEQLARRRECALAWSELQSALRARDALARDEGDRAARVGELEALMVAADGLDAGSEDRLRAERERLRNATALAQAAEEAAEALAPELVDAPGAADAVAGAERALASVAEHAPELVPVVADLTDAGRRLREVASELRAFLASLDAEPGRLDELEGALGRIADAKRRFGVATAGELVERAGEAADELAALAGGADAAGVADAALAAARERFEALASALHRSRAAAAPAFCAAVREELAALGLGDGELRAELREREAGPTGRDEVALHVRANAGLPFAPVASTASGGELSRIALALRTAAHARGGEPTIVFDEIDAGVGGRTAHAVARSLARLAADAQVITITHLPQIASAGGLHLRVEKVPGDPTHTRIERLAEVERRAELERMLGGAEFLDAVAGGSRQ